MPPSEPSSSKVLSRLGRLARRRRRRSVAREQTMGRRPALMHLSTYRRQSRCSTTTSRRLASRTAYRPSFIQMRWWSATVRSVRVVRIGRRGKEVLRPPRDNRDVLASVALPVCIDIDCLIYFIMVSSAVLFLAFCLVCSHGKVQSISQHLTH